jgi:GST-like protein
MIAAELFPRRWQPEDPDAIQLYSMATSNGQKIGIALEETGLEYEAHLVNISQGDQHDEDLVKLNPNGKIPVILDPHGPEDEPMVLMESIIILVYLAEKSGRLLPPTYRSRMEHLQWLSFQTAHIGPMFGQFGHFYLFAKDKTSDDYAKQRYTSEVQRLLKILDDRLSDREYLMQDYSIVDIACIPWVNTLDGFYGAGEVLGMDNYSHINRWREAIRQRPAYQRGIKVCALEG